MGKRLNEAFLNVYLELERLCCDKFGVNVGGVTEYIIRLNNARFAPGRDDVLPKLVRYKNLKNRFENDHSAIRKTDDITGDDIKCMKRFCRDIKKKKDPISKYLKKAWIYGLKKKLGRVLTTVLILAVIALACVVAYFVTR